MNIDIKYKVGDKVRVRSDLKFGERYNGYPINEYMSRCIGKEVTISGSYAGKYTVLESKYGYFVEEMFEGKVDNMSELEELKEQVAEIQKKIEELERTEQKEKSDKQGIKKGESYYSVSTFGRVDINIWNEHKLDKDALSIGNVFKTKQEVEFEIERKKILTEMSKFSFEPDWDNSEQRKHFICFNYPKDEIFIGYTINYGYALCYFETKDDIKECIKVVGKDRIKKYYFGIK